MKKQSNESSSFEFFSTPPVLGIPALSQVLIISVLYVLMILGYYFQVKTTGKMAGYSPGVSLLFVPIYEEMIFRGILLKYFEKQYDWKKAIILVSFLFGLWHLKNIFWLNPSDLFQQIAYTSLFFSPVTCWITIKTRSIWPAVAIHFLNNMPYESVLQFFQSLFK